jgi:hypothetical protein
MAHAVFLDLKGAINDYQVNAGEKRLETELAKLQNEAYQWDVYFQQGRAQTWLDLLLSTTIHRSNTDWKTKKSLAPPSTQYFLLHPNAVLEYVDAAPDGDQLKGAISVEWIGINWWKGIPIPGTDKFLPIGISATSLYSDRPNIDDVGHGVTFYLWNKYALGYSNHGGDHGVFLSMDLMQAFDKADQKRAAYTAILKGL